MTFSVPDESGSLVNIELPACHPVEVQSLGLKQNLSICNDQRLNGQSSGPKDGC
jgi:hypothetical protein